MACSKCKKNKCCCPKRITKLGTRGKTGPAGPKGDKGDQGDPGEVVYHYVKDNGTQPILNNDALNLDDPDLVLPNVPAGTYIAMFDADTLFSRDGVSPEYCYANYSVNSLVNRGSVKRVEETTQDFKFSFVDRIALATPTTLTIKYRLSSDIPLTPFADASSQLQIFARAFTLIKVG